MGVRDNIFTSFYYTGNSEKFKLEDRVVILYLRRYDKKVHLRELAQKSLSVGYFSLLTKQVLGRVWQAYGKYSVLRAFEKR